MSDPFMAALAGKLLVTLVRPAIARLALAIGRRIPEGQTKRILFRRLRW